MQMGQQVHKEHKTDDGFQKYAKLKVFEITKYLIQACEDINPFIFYALFFIEGLQILWFSIHPDLDFIGSPFLLQYIRLILQYLNFQAPLRQNSDLLMPFIILSFTIIIIYVSLFIISLALSHKIQTKQKQSFLAKVIIKVTAIQTVLLNTIFTIPIFNVSLITLYCNKASPFFSNSSMQCYAIPHLVCCIFAAINLAVIGTCTLYFWFIFYTKNPFSENYFASPSNLQRLAKFIIKIVPAVYFMVDYEKGYQDVYMFVYLATLLFNLVMLRFFGSNQYSYQNFCVQFFIQNFLLWFLFNLLIIYYLGISTKTNLIMIESVICAGLLSFTIQELYRKKQSNFLTENLTKVIKKNNMNKFMQILIEIILKNSKFIRVNPLGCLLLLNENLKDKKIQFYDIMAKTTSRSIEFRKTIIKFLIVLLQNLKKDNSTIQLKYMWTTLLYEKGSRIICFHEMAEINQEKLSVADEFMYYIFKTTHKIYDDDSNQRDSDQNNAKIEKYLQFTELMYKFEREIESAAKSTQQFWQQLCEEIPSTKKVFSLANHNNEKVTKIQQIFEQIEKIFPQNVSSIFLYNAFLTDVGTNFKEKRRIENKIENLSKRNNQEEDPISNKKIRFLANENMGVMNIGTIHSNLGVILNSNSQVKALLGYDRIEVIGQKVTKIMPKIYQDIHDSFIMNYLSRADEVKLPVQKTVYGMKKDFKIVQLYLAIKIFPRVNVDFQMIGFFKGRIQAQENADILVNLKNLEVVGMSESFLELTNHSIKLSEVNREFIKLNQIFPELELAREFNEKEQINTVLRFSDCTDKLIHLEQYSEENNHNGGEEVVITVKSISHYQNSTLAVMEVNLRSGISSCLSLQKKVMMAKNGLKENFVPRKQKNDLDKTLLYETAMQEDKNLTLDKKVKDFIENHSFLREIKWSKIIFVCLMLAFIGVGIFLELNESVNRNDIGALIKEIEISEKIIEQGALMLFLNQRIYEMYDDPKIWDARVAKQLVVVDDLETSVLELFELASQRDNQSLYINEQIQYQFISTINEAGDAEIQNSLYIDGIFQIIFLAKQAAIVSSEQLMDPSVDLVESRNFIKENMEKLVPSITQKITSQYSLIFDTKIARLIQVTYLFFPCKSVLLVILYIGVLIIIWKFNSFNYLAISIYNSILKWDSYELESRCRKFMVHSFDDKAYEKNDQIRYNELLKVIPKTLFLQLSNLGRDSENRISININSSDKKTSKKYLSLQNMQEKENTLLLKSQKSRSSFLSVHPSQKINILSNFSSKIRFVVTLIFIFMFLGVELTFFFISKEGMDYDINLKKNYVNLGNFTKSTLYSFYFGYELLKEEGSDEYKQDYDKELSTFYQSSSYVEHLIGEPYSNLRDIYLLMENLNALLSTDNYTGATKRAYFIRVEEQIMNQMDEVTQIRSSQIKAILQKKAQSRSTHLIIKMVTQVVISTLFFIYILFGLFRKLEEQNRKSCCLLSILPLWLINKNENIKSYLIGKYQEDDAPYRSSSKSSRSGKSQSNNRRLIEELEDEKNLLQNSSYM